jgi:hypothetical protein
MIQNKEEQFSSIIISETSEFTIKKYSSDESIDVDESFQESQSIKKRRECSNEKSINIDKSSQDSRSIKESRNQEIIEKED